MVEERIAALYPEGRIRCPVHLSLGQEAVAVGVCAALETGDWVLSGHRSHGHYLAKGGSLPAMIAELFGKATGCTSGKGGSMHLLDLDAGFVGAVPIVGSTIPIAVGCALGSRMRGVERVVVSFFGEGATEEGVFHEALNFAALKRLPVVFVCENNRYSVYSPLDVRQPARPIEDLALAHGVPSARGDGQDAEEVLRLAADAVHRARCGEGPTLLVFDTYRWMEHCGPFDDDHLGYRPAAEVSAWRARDPLALLEERVRRAGIVSGDEIDARRAIIAGEIDAAVAFSDASPFPAPHELLVDVVAP